MPPPERPLIALIEDDPIMGESLQQRFSLEGFGCRWWREGAAALAELGRIRPDAMVCDVRLPDMDGEEVFRRAAPLLGHVPVLFITAFGEIDQAVRLIRAGANDYITKPFAVGELIDRLRHLLQRQGEGAAAIEGTLGVSPAMCEIERTLRRVADIESSVLLTGESGVGKEVAARFLHGISTRRERPFVAVNCAAIPLTLIDSEIFGHEKGAFTGAHARHQGYAERAGEGTLFLDEISELPVEVQGKLLRLLQERVFYRVGGRDLLRFSARLVCATNADLAGRVREGSFREDLFYRVDVISVPIPPLRERREEILPIIRHYVQHFAKSFGREVRGLTTLAEEAALTHGWPGNVRELRNRVERAVALADGPWIGSADLFSELGFERREELGIAPLSEVREMAERRHIIAALDQTGHQIGQAAKLLGVSRTTLWEKMRKLNLQAEPQSRTD